MAFSGALTLTDLNDFITPSQSCIKPVEQTNAPTTHQSEGMASTEIRVDSEGAYYEVSLNGLKTKSDTQQQKLQTADISLNDCLACSGCITSAESVLISMQSHTEVLNFLANNPEDICVSHKVPVLSIAPQSLASLAASISSSSTSAPLPLHRIMRRVEVFCKKVLGFEHVFDTTFARHLALQEHIREFRERKSGQGQLPMLASACPGWVCYAEKTHAEMLPFISRTKSPQQVMGTLVKEWMATKWHKSPSQIYHVTVMPCYDKKLEASRQDFYNDVYSTRDVDCVITTGELELMMREKDWDLSIPVEGEITDEIVSEQVISESSAPANDIHLPELINHPGTSSGSYLHTLIRSVVQDHPHALDLSVRNIRSSDYEEYTLTDRSSGEVVFRGAKCYGFRNLQNLVRKVGRDAGVQVGRGAAGRLGATRGRAVRTKKGESAGSTDKSYDYVEVMACPGGCVNGGGQLKPGVKAADPAADEEGFKRDWDSSGVKLDGEDVGRIQGQSGKWGDKEWTKKVEVVYWHELPTPPPSPTPDGESGSQKILSHLVDAKNQVADRLAVRILSETCKPDGVEKTASWTDSLDQAAEGRRQKLFRTQYRAVESEVVGLAVKW